MRHRQPHAEGHLLWANAYCPKCFTKPNPRGCKKLNEDGHWNAVALAAAKAAVGTAGSAMPSASTDEAADGSLRCKPCHVVAAKVEDSQQN